MNSDQIGGIIRSFIIAAGGILVAKGYLSDAQLIAIAGAIAILGGIGWSIYTNSTPAMIHAITKDEDVVKVVVSPALVFATDSPKVVAK